MKAFPDDSEDSVVSYRVRALLRSRCPAAEVLSHRPTPRGVERTVGAAARAECVEPDAVILDRGRNSIVLVARVECVGVATAEVARRWRSQFGWWTGSIEIVTAFRRRADFAQLVELPAWGSYAWFEAEPDHVVLFRGSGSGCDVGVLPE